MQSQTLAGQQLEVDQVFNRTIDKYDFICYFWFCALGENCYAQFVQHKVYDTLYGTKVVRHTSEKSQKAQFPLA